MTASYRAARELLEQLRHADGQDTKQRDVDFTRIVLPPAPLLPLAVELLRDTNFEVGAQDVHWEDDGAFTGALSPAMVAEIGARFTLCGHSERRQVFGERDEEIGRKVRAAHAAGLRPILCVGETADERARGESEAVVLRQLAQALESMSDVSGVIVAYEPVWAIGSGLAATAADVDEIHAAIRGWLVRERGAQNVPILYGGSVKPENAATYLGAGRPAEVAGVLVGGASRDAQAFRAILETARATTVGAPR